MALAVPVTRGGIFFTQNLFSPTNEKSCKKIQKIGVKTISCIKNAKNGVKKYDPFIDPYIAQSDIIGSLY